jgi:polyisoprenoid-binding protein YceI
MSTTTTTSATGTYSIDPTHSRIGFVARHAMVTKVRGSFNDFEGTGRFDAADPTKSEISLVIQATSIDTRNADRDTHLRSNDFFAMEEFPEISFTSTSVSVAGDNQYEVTGDLTMKGITHPVTIDFTHEGNAVDPYGTERIGLEGTTTVNRKDWGISFNAPLETGGVLIGEKVTLEFEVSAVRS